MQKQKRHHDVIMDRLDIMPPQAPYTSMHFDRQSDQNLHYLNIFACLKKKSIVYDNVFESFYLLEQLLLLLDLSTMRPNRIILLHRKIPPISAISSKMLARNAHN